MYKVILCRCVKGSFKLTRVLCSSDYLSDVIRIYDYFSKLYDRDDNSQYVFLVNTTDRNFVL